MSAAKCQTRIEILKNDLEKTYSDRLFHQRKQVFDRIFAAHTSEPRVLQVAFAEAAFLAEKEIAVSPHDLLAGNLQFYDFDTQGIEPVQGDNEFEASILEQFRKGYRIGLFCGALGGHVIAGYHRVLEMGFDGIIESALKCSSESSDSDKAFCEGSLAVSRAASEYALRYAAEARRVARVSDESQRRDLERIAASCEWISVHPPRSFHEALQLICITHEIITIEQRSGSLSLGRLDQILNPYYIRDLESGVITADEGQELIEALWIKFAGLRRGFQNITFGGSDGHGNDLTNDLSYFFLRATKRLRMDQPLLSVRWHRGTPVEFWEEVQDLIQEGMGFPALFNEQLVIDAKIRVGVTPEDATDWGIVGCVEPSIPGKEFSHTEGIRVNWAKVLELVLSGGRCTVTGESFGLAEDREPTSLRTFEEFYDWYRSELRTAVRLAVEGMNILDRKFHEIAPYPFLSSTMEGCIEHGMDVTAGSTIYNFCTVNTLGMANVADSLSAIKETVYDKHICTLEELSLAVSENFSEHDSLRRSLKSCSAYGNDQETPDSILAELCADFRTTLMDFRNGRGGPFQCGFYTVDSHGPIGEKTGALPDGRLQGVALANALSPVQGSDTIGPTAVMNSCTKVDHLDAGNGMVLDLKFTPSFFRNICERGVFTSLVQTYFEKQGMEIQFNVIDRETLQTAKDRPDDFRDLVVRVSGFSAYFVDLPAVVQNEIIDRTEYSSV